jgi:Fe-S-cluster containining protein
MQDARRRMQVSPFTIHCSLNNNTTLLSLKDTFRFACSDRVSCFNDCCQDLNQYLTPYDILRLKNCLGLPSGLFLERYTAQHTGPESGLPIITLRPEHAQGLKCPFVTSKGCSVYEDRPSSCRTYPLMRVVSRLRENGRINEQYVLLKESHCRGFDRQHTQTVTDWIESQGLELYHQMNDMMMEIISLKNRLMPGPLDVRDRLAFHLACYDLDKFRAHIFEKGILEDRKLDPVIPETLKNDDIALLKFGLKWIKERLFGQDESN